MLKKFLYFTAIIALGVGLFYLGLTLGRREDESLVTSKIPDLPQPTPLAIYSFENLANTIVPSGNISLGKELDAKPKYTSYQFNFRFSPTLVENNLKTTSGQIIIPKDNNKHPLIVMFRGFVDQTLYQTGMGTHRAAEYFAENGFITISPDFLGYADSDPEAGNIFETRFQTYTTALSLLNSVDQIKNYDQKNLFIWGHSNGGQVAITTLELSGKTIPTTLWAPVTKPFPYSILYYTDDSVDGGKLIRKELAKFENIYNTDYYSLTNYLDKINAPIQIHQGTADDAVPWQWSQNFVKKLKSLDKDINIYTYPGADHNLTPGWDTVVARDVLFFKEHLLTN